MHEPQTIALSEVLVKKAQAQAADDSWCMSGRKINIGNADIVYATSLDGQIVPIEVKSSATGSLRSLHQFMGEKNLPVAIRFDASVPSSMA